MDKYFYSIYGPFITEFIAFKRQLGYKYTRVEYIFTAFDNIAFQRKETTVGITKDLADEWCSKALNQHYKTHYYKVQFLRQFSLFLSSINYPSYLPPSPPFKSTFVPYIFTREEVDKILRASDQLRPRRSGAITPMLPALFRLLYATGIRLGEALNLSLEDVNLTENYLTLRQCKNGKDRLVPFSGSLQSVLIAYLNYRKKIPFLIKSDIFFVHPNGKAINIHIVYPWFRKILYNVNIAHGGRGKGPRIHDLRHTFACHSLAGMAEAGIDLYYSLPILSTYLGHESIAATERYLWFTSDMFPSVIANANKMCPYLFPQIHKPDSDETN